MSFKKKIKEINKTLKSPYYNISIYIIWIVLGTSLFWIGFHNVDLSTNVLRISYYENLNYTNFYDSGFVNNMSYDTAYVQGLASMMIASFFFIPIGLLGLVSNIKRVKKWKK